MGTSWNELDPSYQRALTSLAYNVGGRKAGEQWTAVLRAAKDRDVTEFARQLRRQDAGRYTAGMDNRVMKELKFAGLIDKRRDVSSVLPLADRRSGIAN
jgi:GH24 family phage-related lysozyme (muramidase)